MVRSKDDNEVALSEIKKSLDRLVLIELCAKGATTQQIRDIFGSIDNNLVSKIRKAVRGGKLEE